MKKLFFAIVPLAVLLAIPLILRPADAKIQARADEALTILSPHTETIKNEINHAFLKYYRQKTGRVARIDWLNVGGTSDIVRYINEHYTTAFRRQWEKSGRKWNADTAENFKNPRVPDHPARREFLNSRLSIGIDVFFGGGAYDQNRLGECGFAVSADLRQRCPEYFANVPETFSGETLRHPRELFYGVCLSSFGICYNPESLAMLKNRNAPQPRQWADLAHPAFFNQLIAADPTKSGSINRCYEMILQQAMQQASDPNAGWEQGFTRLQCILANARAVTDSAGKVTQEIANGNGAVGMAIDFYAFCEADWSRWQTGGRPRIVYVAPQKGSTVSCDPVQLLRGAPHCELAREFIAFLLSPAGQKLWFFRAGAPGGPVRSALRRPPVLRNLYAPEFKRYLSDPDYNPYTAAEGFKYRSEYTGRYFNLIRVVIKCAFIDVRDELQRAWEAIIAAGGAEKCPRAWAEFSRPAVSRADAPALARRLQTLEGLTARRDLTIAARKKYRLAEQLARAHQ